MTIEGIKKFFSRKPHPPSIVRPAPCGEPLKHWYWKDQRWPCPVCSRIASDRQKEEEENMLARKIAAELAKYLMEGE